MTIYSASSWKSGISDFEYVYCCSYPTLILLVLSKGPAKTRIMLIDTVIKVFLRSNASFSVSDYLKNASKGDGTGLLHAIYL